LFSSHDTHHHIPEQQSTKAEGEVGGGFEIIGLTYQHRNEDKQHIVHNTLETPHMPLKGKVATIV
jgi:hypothetical protein